MDGREISTFCAGMDDPKGIVLMGNFLITTDFKKVWKINNEGKKEILAGPEVFPNPPLFLNDVVLAPAGKSMLATNMGARDKMFDLNKQLWPLNSPEGKGFPAAGRVYRITPDGIEAQTILVLENLKAIVEAAGGTLGDVVKTMVYLQKLGDFAGGR